MIRSLILAALLYVYGDPGLDVYRPRAVDRPLQDFHRDIDHAAVEGKRALKTLDDARSMRYLNSLLRQMDELVRRG